MIGIIAKRSQTIEVITNLLRMRVSIALSHIKTSEQLI